MQTNGWLDKAENSSIGFAWLLWWRSFLFALLFSVFVDLDVNV